MKKRIYTQPTMEVCELEINQPILAGSDPNISEGDGNNPDGEGGA